VETDASGVHTAIVKGYGLNHGQFAKDANWQQAYEPAFEDFIANLEHNGNLGLAIRSQSLDLLFKAISTNG